LCAHRSTHGQHKWKESPVNAVVPKHTLVDLHVHSSSSDGLLSPYEVVRLAAHIGIGVLGLTDHDTTQGIDEAIAAGQEYSVEIIPGIELSTSVDAGELHMLGYFIDYHSPVLQSRLAEFQEARRSRAERIVQRLHDIGVTVDSGRVQELAGGESVGRAHVARALVEAGYVTSMDEAFDQYLSRGRPAYVERPRLTPVDAVALIHRVGGVAVLAHPFTVDDLDSVVPDLVDAGLDGLEVFYSLYNTEQRRDLAEIARKFGLVPTGGSDFHGSGEREGREIGTASVPWETVGQLRERQRHSR
jgi:predicted metal-dependent phosphoesterase TrpH